MRKTFLTNSNTKYGAKYNKENDTVEFTLASYTAQDVVLCVFKKPVGAVPFLKINMEKDGHIFRATVPANKLFIKKKVFYYGYRIFGENFPKSIEYKEGSDIGFISKLDNQGNRFNPNKLAYDPWGLELSHVHSAVSSDMTAFRSGSNHYLSDNSKIAPKTVFKIIKEQKLKKASPRALKDEIIGEVHLRDLTKSTRLPFRGTCLGAALFADKIKKTGITMLEFLPTSEFDSYINDKNHWGYMPLSYFAFKKGYSSDKSPYGALYEFRKLINELHKKDIKVCLDVVYNHTGEGATYGNNDDANLFSYALIDNKNYYKLAQNAHYTNHSGCGNDLNTYTPISIDLIVESLNFWIKQGIDAFRFDLAVCLMDTSASGYAMYNKTGGMLSVLKKRLEDLGNKILLPNEKGEGTYLIAEPWMCSGAYNYQLGNFPEYFAEWNDISRDIIRAISIRPYNVSPYDMRNIIEGTFTKFQDKTRSINYVSCHDGFSLFDLNTYNKPNPKTKGGFAGEMCSDYSGDISRQNNEIKKQILILMISKGIPMVQFGDIFLHSKGGNNNSYNLDDETNSINYKLNERKTTLHKFIKEMINFRKQNRIFTQDFFNERIEYLFPHSAKIDENDHSYWRNNSSNIICFKINDVQNNFYIAISKDENKINLTLPKNTKNKKWHLITDTTQDFINLKGKKYEFETYELKPYGACIFKEK